MKNDPSIVVDAFRNCITEPKCRDCPWEQCEEMNNRKIKIPVDLCLDVMQLLADMYPRMKVCQNCGLEYPETNYTCPRCGNKSD